MGRLRDMKTNKQQGLNEAWRRNVATPRKRTASAVTTSAGWKGTASAVPTGAQSSLGFSPGSSRLKPGAAATGFRRAKARRFHPTCLLALAGAMAMLSNAGCSRAPSFNILGSFFPAWLLCGVIGIALAVVTRFIFLRYDFEKELAPLILVYPALALFYTFTTWLLFFS